MATQQNVTRSARHQSLGVRLGIVKPDYPGEAEFKRGRGLLTLYASVVALFAVSFALLTVAVKESDTKALDTKIAEWIQGSNLPGFLHAITQTSVYNWTFTHLSILGNSPWDLITYVTVLAVLFAIGMRIEAFVAVGGSAAAAGIGYIVRNLVDRTRPSGSFLHVVNHVTGPGFPSGHVMMYVTLFGFLFYAVFIAWRWNILKAVVLTVLALLVILIGVSRVYLGAHWPTDTTGAYLLGWIIVAGMIEVHRTALYRFATFKRTKKAPALHGGAQPV